MKKTMTDKSYNSRKKFEDEIEDIEDQQTEESEEDEEIVEEALTFDDLGLKEKVLLGVKEAGFTHPTPIQADVIPVLLEGSNVIGKAQTGSGKTASFALPALNILKNNGSTEILVLVPTRELSQQVVDSFNQLGKFVSRLQVVSVVGGENASKQIREVNHGAQVVVATPGRLLDHLSSNKFKNFAPKLVVLDEADEMMDMGFIEDIKEIFTYLPKERQTALFSATMPAPILALAREEIPDAVIVKATGSDQQNENIERDLYVVNASEREDALIRIMEFEQPTKAIVFCRTRQETDDLCQSLNKQGILSRAIHGDLNQTSRIQVMNQIKEGNLKIMVATDVASRGIDISDLSHVFNYHTPENKERFTHRIGRTGRAGNKGKAVTISTPMEIRKHTFFKQYSIKKFNILAVPTLSQIKEKAAEKLLTSFNEVHISRLAKNVLPQLNLGEINEEAEATILKLLTLALNSNNSISGPQNIGYTPEYVMSLLKGGGGDRRSDRRGKPDSRGGRFDRRGRGYSNRSESSRGEGSSSSRGEGSRSSNREGSGSNRRSESRPGNKPDSVRRPRSRS